MEKHIYDNNNGLWYELQGDYYIPCLVLDEKITQPIGIWGRKYLRHIKEHRPVLHTTLLLSGKLNGHIAEIGNRATEMFDRLVKQLAEKEGITEQLKTQDQMAWVGAMNNIRNAAEEIVLSELIYN
ncbi:MAG: TnpV protein [Oscillospiraceae bacterium]|nr:TnpV protein [Oscillospiraceae bacterium]